MKTKIVLLIVFVGFAVLLYHNPSNEYWQAIGPSWDKMFNPVDYNK
jgi:hypothetical protein